MQLPAAPLGGSVKAPPPAHPMRHDFPDPARGLRATQSLVHQRLTETANGRGARGGVVGVNPALAPRAKLLGISGSGEIQACHAAFRR
jgi:hypothetical protein